MLLRLRIRNFKSIADAEVRFGPTTCFIGANGVGKSNLFDSISFLGLLASHDVQSAAAEVRRSAAGMLSPLDLVYERDPQREITIEADLLVPAVVHDDYHVEAEASTTRLTYAIRLQVAGEAGHRRLVVASEDLRHWKKSEARARIGFEHSVAFRDSVATGRRSGGPLIATSEERGQVVIRLHGDGGSRGRPLPVGRSPQTVLGGTASSDHPTVMAARREMESWRTMQLEPSAMRSPSTSLSPAHVDDRGHHLATTLRTLGLGDDLALKQRLLNRLNELGVGLVDLRLDEDAARDQLSVQARFDDEGPWLSARSLSDGTLRFLVLATMVADTKGAGLLCMEEPENGLHPSRVPNLVDLLRDYAVDPQETVGEDNPARQTIINTHSPDVVRQLSTDEMVFVERVRPADGADVAVFRPVEDTWRARLDERERGNTSETRLLPPVSRQRVRDYVGGAPLADELQSQLQLPLEIGSAA